MKMLCPKSELSSPGAISMPPRELGHMLLATWLDKAGVRESECPFCGCNLLTRYHADAHDTDFPKLNQVAITQCTSCIAAWQWPLQRTPAESVVEFLGAYDAQAKESYFDPTKRASIAQLQREFVMAEVETTGRLLDVGCGDGCFARIMAEQGWDVTGLDPALRCSVEAKNLRLIRGTFSELPAGERYDAITLWDVIEHVEDPLKLIIEAYKWLAPNGVMIIETGNFQSSGRITEAQAWWNYQLDHRWYLSPPQLAQLMCSAGLADIKLADRVLRPWWKGTMDMPAPSRLNHFKAFVKRPHYFRRVFERYQELLAAYKGWGGWGGMEIMTLTGRAVP